MRGREIQETRQSRSIWWWLALFVMGALVASWARQQDMRAIEDVATLVWLVGLCAFLARVVAGIQRRRRERRS